MADRWAIANGNWSDTATWNGGTLPTSADDVYADGKTVTINQTITVLSLRTTTRSGGLGGGVFNMSGQYNITASGAGILATGTCLNYSGESNITITGNIAGNDAGSTASVIISGTSPEVTILGNLRGGASGVGQAINLTGASSKLFITGNCSGGSGNGPGLTASGLSNVINITGNCEGANGLSTSCSGILVSGNNAVVTITGNCTGGRTGNSHGADVTGTSASITVTGNVIGGLGGSSHGVRAPGASSTVTVVGSATANLEVSHGILSSATTNGVIFQGNLTDSTRGATAVFARLFRITATNDGVTKNTVTTSFPGEGTSVSRISSSDTSGVPGANNVRQNIVFGSTNQFTGSMAVPPAQNVAYGLPVSTTIGSAYLDVNVFADLLTKQLAATKGFK